MSFQAKKSSARHAVGPPEPGRAEPGKPTGDAAAPPVSQKHTEAGKRAGPGGAGLIRHVYLGLARLGSVCRGHGC